MGNIAFKFNFCDGKDKKTDFGFKRLCSENFITYNIEKRKADWCSHSKCPCRKWYNGEISYNQLEEIWGSGSICGESNLLTEWIAYAEYDTRNNEWIGRSIRKAEEGSLCVLTAVKPNMDEKSRKIFAVFIIDEVYEGDEEQCGYVVASEKYRMELSVAETNYFNFWNYYRNENTHKQRWGQGVFRYLSDEQSAQILKKLVEIKSSTNEYELAKEMLIKFCNSKNIDVNDISVPLGANIIRS